MSNEAIEAMTARWERIARSHFERYEIAAECASELREMILPRRPMNEWHEQLAKNQSAIDSAAFHEWHNREGGDVHWSHTILAWKAALAWERERVKRD